MDQGIDAGDIIDYARFQIEDTDASFSIFQKTQKRFVMFTSQILIRSYLRKSSEFPQEYLIQNIHERRHFKSGDLDVLKIVDPSKMTLEELDRHARAFDFPGHEPAYFLFEDRKIYLTTRKYTLNTEKHISDMSIAE